MDSDRPVDFECGPSQRRRQKTPSAAFTRDSLPRGLMATKPSQRRTRSHLETDLDHASSSDWTSPSLFDNSAGSSSAESSRRSPRPSVSGLHLPLVPGMPHQQPRRFHGDGLDFRRPVTLSPADRDATQPAVIDLTADDSPAQPPIHRQRRPQRPPRFANEIIDLDSDNTGRVRGPPTGSDDSPEVQFVSMRRLEADRRRIPEDEDVVLVSSHRIPGRPNPYAEHARGIAARFVMGAAADNRRLLRQEGRPEERRRRADAPWAHRFPLLPPLRTNRAPQRRYQGPNLMNIDMDYDMVGFDLGLNDPTLNPPAPPPTYDAPSPASTGFTRSPDEDTPFACPNCGNELCKGSSDLQKQVWVLKGCGHVYCGMCATYRFVTKRKGVEIDPAHTAFKSCVVGGCDKKAHTAKAMIQVFL
ncbi:hypothetical protein M011DRAFT_471552 [Sporormia fimetaria CBS 119925]|uniref:Uncharacterized protein n=1 Tax=Sporormia fimetaria CBS 119925 TaxID=1340428 RepID=A0A6A6UY41_9PLEO|nr:hypothetical protein M011DRAFT_471552 [Sporormia fimetaria CBS 119925]